MTTNVLTIGPEASIRDVAKILTENGISGLPVCDLERRVLGVVSEADILYKEQARKTRGGALAWLSDGGAQQAAPGRQPRCRSPHARLRPARPCAALPVASRPLPDRPLRHHDLSRRYFDTC
jgi:hypothetical protein